MARLQIAFAAVALAFFVGASCYMIRVPDLSFSDAAEIISRAPEFNRYARLLKIERLDHAKASMGSMTFGKFTFQYLNVPPDARPVEARVDFRYHEGKWYLSQFDYGCPRDCHLVYVFDGPNKRQ
jgi:hypothetical protein